MPIHIPLGHAVPPEIPESRCEVCLLRFVRLECEQPKGYVGCPHLFHPACTYGSATCPCCTVVQVPLVLLHRMKSTQAILTAATQF